MSTKVVEAFNPPLSWVQETIERAGTKIGSVHFIKRSGGELRKMSYRLHVRKPSTAKAPKGAIKDSTTVAIPTPNIGVANGVITVKWRMDKRAIDKANTQVTVLDCNKVVKDEKGNIIGRGACRTIPLENVTRIVNNGVEYVIKQY